MVQAKGCDVVRHRYFISPVHRHFVLKMDHSQHIRNTINESDEFIPSYLPHIDADDIDERLIDTVNGYPHLYNKADPDHKNLNIIRNTWQ